ncbi:hypothetical protein A2U01_0109983, partial [Trifolium medium]|nr:hypothetical protein [Trifolium medium]
ENIRNPKVPRFSDRKRQKATGIRYFLASARESDGTPLARWHARWASKPCA